MSAHGYIDSIFSRVQEGVAGNERFITERQMLKLRELIGQDEEGGALKPGLNGGFAWMPSGRTKYVVSVYETMRGPRRKLIKMANPVPSGAGELFPREANEHASQ